jgi:hypothetical protein
MGFFDKAIKNIVKKAKPILPVAAMFAAPYLAPKMGAFLAAGGKGAGLGSLLSGYGAKFGAMPMMLKAPVTSGLTSYGLAKLMGQKNPEKAALYSALTAAPFAFMKANAMANALGPDVNAMDLLMAPGGQPLTQTVPQFRTNIEGLPLNVMPKTQMIGETTKTISPGMKLTDLFRTQTAGKTFLGTDLPAGSFDIKSGIPLLAGMLGGMPTDEQAEEMARGKEKRRMTQLYEDMTNPYYSYVPKEFKFTPYEAGGAVNGPGGPKDDAINAKLSDGEFVMTAKAVQNMGNGSRMAGAKKMYQLMNSLDPESEKPSEAMV